MAEHSPYPGLDPFGEAERRYYFGRDGDIQLIVANVFAARVTVLFGPSGVGKTSVLRAGVMPALRERDHVLAALVGTSEAPYADAIRAAVAGAARAADAELPKFGGSLASDLAAVAAGLDRRLVLVLDQFEDQLRGAGAEALLDEIALAISRPKASLSVLIAVREESLAVLDRFEGRVAGVFDNVLRLEYLDAEAGAEAIRAPVRVWSEAAETPMSVEPALVDAVLAGVAAARGGDAVEPAHLQLVMTRVWEAERAAGSAALRLETLTRLGGPEGIVRAHVESALAALSRPERELAAVALDRLVTPSGARIAHLSGDLARYAGVAEPELRAVLERLASQRVLRPVQLRSDGGMRYEVFHELLADAALAWLTRHIAERRAGQARRALRRRMRVLTAVTVASLLALAVVLTLALIARHERQTARSHAFVASSLQLLDVDPVTSLGLARAAVAARDGDQSRAALRAALSRSWERRVVEPDNGPLLSAAIRGRAVLTASVRGRAQLWEGGAPRVLPGRFEVAALCPDAHRIALAGPDGARIGGRALAGPTPAVALACSADGARVAVTDQSGDARIYDGRGNRLARLPASEDGPATAVGLSADGAVAVVVSDLAAVVWQVPERRRLATLQSATGHIVSAAVAPDGRRVLTGAANGDVTLWHVASGRRAQLFRGHRAVVTDVSIDPRGELAASASADRTIRVWDLAAGLTVELLRGHDRAVQSVEFAPDGRELVSAGDDGTARVWETPVAPFAAGQRGAVVAALDRDGARMAVADAAGVIRVWDTRRRVVVQRLRATGTIVGLALGGPHLLAVEEGSGTLWTGGAPAPLGKEPVLAAALSPDGRLVATGHDAGRIVVREANGGPPREFRLRTGDGVVTLAFSDDGRRLAAGTDADLWMVPVTGGGPRHLARDEQLLVVAFDPRGALIATGGADGVARIWDARDGRPAGALRGHLGVVQAVSFSADGRLLATGSADETVRLWDVREGSQLTELPGTGAAFAARGEALVAAGPLRSARLLRCAACGPPAELDARARARSTRPLADADRRRYAG